MHTITRAMAMTHAVTYPDLVDRRVLVTGARSRDGAEVARAFAGHGCRLIVELGRDPSQHGRLTEEFRSHAKAIRVLASDFSDAEGIGRFADAALRAWEGIDIVVNVIEVKLTLGVKKLEVDQLEDTLAELLRVPSRLTRVAAESMSASHKEGAIVNVFSGATEDIALYALAKSALESMTQYEAREWMPSRVRVYGLIKGSGLDLGTRPGRRAPARASQSEDVLDSVRDAALFLTSSRGRWLNGSVLTVGH
jgi:3-oxoacyl-[acyl-carrier protein] reductase